MSDIETMKRFCQEMDTDKSGAISLFELRECLSSERSQAVLKLQGLDVRDAELFFSILGIEDPSEEVDIDLFAEGAMKLKGYANALDIQALLFKVKVMERHQSRWESTVTGRFDRLSSLIEKAMCRSAVGVDAAMQEDTSAPLPGTLSAQSVTAAEASSDHEAPLASSESVSAELLD
eukprot:gnl/TRDRNA2_/TRDRNA2_166912_c1_seq1.p1 gnl/TRDRNA2_/TRDRNA2_166912_c1~~gnl/TRDRNA2_/TRDRNA2_166912_c1_seq1.p1  ORF type:complete len:187 (-),score=36.02 gnl/TRDRNA2_/TRDRNA2_166912_c1_seq1:327-857(-)